MKKIRILSLDGGGIRGIIPAIVLEYIENRIIERTQNPNARIADYFDFIAGTSTGGILTAFYLTPNTNKEKEQPSSKYKASEAVEFYAKEGYKIFNQSKKSGGLIRQLFNASKYSPKALKKILVREFGDLQLKDLLKPCIITTYNMKTTSSFFFTSREDLSKKREFYVKDVLRSTSAAPTYFPPAYIKNLMDKEKQMINIDGGVFANNPSLCAYAECRDSVFKNINPNPPKAKDMFVLSIGTGGGRFNLKKVNNSNHWGLLRWANSIPDIMMDGSIDTVDYQMKQIFDTVRDKKDNKINYKRIDYPRDLDPNYKSDMADASATNIENLKIAGKIAIDAANKEVKGERTLDDVIEMIINN